MKTITLYVHRSKEENFDDGEEIGLEDHALDNFRYACCDVGLDCLVDPETGLTWITGVNGVPLINKVEAQ